jgi:molybdenum cofactor cytidylyltransferase
MPTPAVEVAINPDWATGMGSSIRVGMTAVLERSALVDAVVIALGDQPLISSAFLNSLAERHFKTGATMVAASYADRPGVPALFARALFPRLAALDGQAGAKVLLQAAGNELEIIPAPEAAIDVDTPEDYARLLRAPTD